MGFLLELLSPVLGWAAPFVAKALVGILESFVAKLFTFEVAERTFIDIGWAVCRKNPASVLLPKLVNTAAKELNYGYKPELDK